MFDAHRHDKRDFITVGVIDDNYYHGSSTSKHGQKQSLFRSWKRLSRLQKNLILIVIVLVTLTACLYFTWMSSVSGEESKENNIYPFDVNISKKNQEQRNRVQAVQEFLDKRKQPLKDEEEKNAPPILENPVNFADNDIAPDLHQLQQPKPPDNHEEEKNEEHDQAQDHHIKRDPNVIHKDTDEEVVHLHKDGGEPLHFTGPKNARQKAVVDAFTHAWSAYRKYAWGHDQLKPITRTFHEWFGLGLTIIDSLDTMYIMGLQNEFNEARDWVDKKLNLQTRKDVNLFEVSIRVLGGLLSTYHLSQDTMFLGKAKELGDRLLPAFSSGSPIPWSDVNPGLMQGKPPKWGPDSTVSEVSTIQMEFRDLSRSTNDPKYEDTAFEVSKQLHKLSKRDGLIPMFISAQTGQFRPGGTITMGARADSYYEYLLKQWIQTGKTIDWLKEDYLAALEGIKKNLLRKTGPNNLSFIGELVGGNTFRPKMDHLVCFFAGLLALGHHNGLGKGDEHLDLSRELLHTCYQMYARMPTFLSPEIAHFNMLPGTQDDIYVKGADAHNLLRPETVESLYYLYQLTGESKYQDLGWKIFQAFERHTRLDEQGYTSINNVKNSESPGWRDTMESFFLGETLKYLYLLFDDDPKLINFNKWVFNTEGHILPIRES